MPPPKLPPASEPSKKLPPQRPLARAQKTGCKRSKPNSPDCAGSLPELSLPAAAFSPW